MEMLEFSALRSHALITLIERDRLQLVYADRSVIVTSSIINLRTNDGLDKFLAMLIAFHRLSPKQWGLLSLIENPSLTKLNSSKILSNSTTEDEKHEWLHGSTMRLQREGTEPDIRLKLGDVLYHQPGIIGRGTCVIEARCDSEWTNQELVVKVSWPSKNPPERGTFTFARQKEGRRVGEREEEAAPDL
ncbi:hypothetical protein BDZ94DRAFT_1063880 [Collybia nuda]|uniref:Fungal-type protein kinase domain-containing protein n=1 Tax=Collybia nuda TaxID=64659 RepID=A0A9P6CFK6_9AGAR|nr:hypothetical protein BDZ94DRAFT_1063880 [Collybia nuda]